VRPQPFFEFVRAHLRERATDDAAGYAAGYNLLEQAR
jgi:hypothetical protein